MSDVVIRAEELGKKYVIGHETQRERYTALRDVIARGAQNFLRKASDMVHGRPIIEGDELEEVWALRDVDFEVKRGEVVGIIGRNGAGKSTLLKILSRITEPSEGRVSIKGRVASLLEIGTGFHPELTGRENIFLNGAILGMTRAEIKRKFDEIVAFAEVDKFLDTPVKRYSSGMYVRLAFAVAANLEPEILVVDEVLAVGDAQFQKKCLGKIESVAVKEGRTVLFVSHNMAAVQQLCSTAMLLQKGMVNFVGPVQNAVAKYMASSVGIAGSWKGSANCTSSKMACLTEITLNKPDGTISAQYLATEEIGIRIELYSSQRIAACQLAVRLVNSEGVPIFTTTSVDHLESLEAIEAGVHEYCFAIPGSFLSVDRYLLNFCLCIPNVQVIDIVLDDVAFDVVDAVNHASRFYDSRKGVVTPLLKWKHLTRKV